MTHFPTSWRQVPKKQLVFLGIVVLLYSLISEKALPGEPATLSDRYIAMAIQGDLSGAANLFDEVLDANDPAAAELHRQYQARFFGEHDSGVSFGLSPYLGAVISAYRGYWRKGLLRKGSMNDDFLEREVNRLLEKSVTAPGDRPHDFESLPATLSDLGVHFFQSSDPPLRDLLIWEREHTRRYSVRLTDRKVDLAVHFMDGFLLRGWKDYASLGRVSTTGWVADGDLYCMAEAYDTSTERFAVSFLKHEARHLLDLETYPAMTSQELEYRAKLTELAFADRSLISILDDFTSKAAPNPESPHAMANWRVSRDVHYQLYGVEMEKGFPGWDSVRVGKVNRAARKLLKINDEKWKKQCRLVL